MRTQPIVPPVLPPQTDAFLQAYKLHVSEISNEKIREVFRQVCYVPAWEAKSALTFREVRLLKSFGHSLELAYYDRENWAIMYTTALMLIAKFKLLEGK